MCFPSIYLGIEAPELGTQEGSDPHPISQKRATGLRVAGEALRGLLDLGHEARAASGALGLCPLELSILWKQGSVGGG